MLLLARTALGTALPQVRRRISLSGLTEAVLGRGLDKTEQCSAWGARPLRPEQLAYAAADAHAVVALYRELNRRRVGLDSPFWVSHFSGERAGWPTGRQGRGRCCVSLQAAATCLLYLPTELPFL